MSEIIWNIPSLQAYERLDQLREAVETFPHSALVPCWLHEIEDLKRLLHQ